MGPFCVEFKLPPTVLHISVFVTKLHHFQLRLRLAPQISGITNGWLELKFSAFIQPVDDAFVGFLFAHGAHKMNSDLLIVLTLIIYANYTAICGCLRPDQDTKHIVSGL